MGRDLWQNCLNILRQVKQILYTKKTEILSFWNKEERWRRKPTRCYSVFYCTCNRLNMFQTPLCPSSGARGYTADYHMRCLTPWLRVVSGQVQGGWLSVQVEGCCMDQYTSSLKRRGSLKRFYVTGTRSLPCFALRWLYGFSLILNGAWSDDGLNRWPYLVTIVNCW
jgi:hypothetical protein